jgi:hypothetical protein
LVGLGDQWFDSVVEILHARRYLCPVLFAVYCESYRSDELGCEENGLLRLDEEGPCLCKLMLEIVTCWIVDRYSQGRFTSGSGDCGKLVVKRESNSGIAGGCREILAVVLEFSAYLQSTHTVELTIEA